MILCTHNSLILSTGKATLRLSFQIFYGNNIAPWDGDCLWDTRTGEHLHGDVRSGKGGRLAAYGQRTDDVIALADVINGALLGIYTGNKHIFRRDARFF